MGVESLAHFMCAKASTSTQCTWITTSQATLMATCSSRMSSFALLFFILNALFGSFVKLSDQSLDIPHTARVVQHMSV